jgi:hypothetical protein
MDCYGENKLIRDEIILTSHISRADKMMSLSAVGVPVTVTDDNNDLDDLYEALITNKQATYDENITHNIKYPLYPSSYLKEINKITTFDLKEGGRYFHNNILSVQQKFKLTELLTEFVTLPTTINTDESKYYKIIPNIIRNFAEGSRIGSGYRLIKRAVRHAMDPKSIDIQDCEGHVFEINNNIGLVLKHKIKASMKTAIYDVTVALTSSNLVACTCTCKAGSINNEKIVCVHILPVIYQIGQLMWRGVSEHMLFKFTNVYHSENNVYLAIHQNNNNFISTLQTLV